MVSFAPLPTWLARVAVVVGLAATYWYAAAGLTLAHYDAKAHLVVSRRILDSLTPGWEQIGAVWLPLPHVLNTLPAQIDLLYRTGGFAIAVSVLANALATASIAGIILGVTRSRAGAVAGAALYLADPNLLYLQSTPMTEPLLYGLTTFQVYLMTTWSMRGRLEVPRDVGWVMVLACLTRYEAWPVTAASLVVSGFVWWRRGHALRDVARVHARLASFPCLAILLFFVLSRATVGEWFVSGGFFEPDESMRGQPSVIVERIREGLGTLAGERFVRIALLSTVVVTAVGMASPGRATLLLALAPLAAAALPLAAYYAGHPFRIRYEVPLIVAGALIVGVAVGLTRRLSWPLALVVLLAVVLQRPPVDASAAMVMEAQLDQNVRARAQVTSCLTGRFDGGAIMASMGSLGHYMHELSQAGFDIDDFLHEGNGPIWDSAFTRGPVPLVEWVLLEEVAEGGDALARRQRALPRLLEQFDRVCDGGNVALYRRRARAPE